MFSSMPGPSFQGLIDSKFNTQDVYFRNFEALKRAEEQLEREDLARKEVFC